MSAHLIKQAEIYEEAASKLELAAQHLRRSAEHFRSNEVPRGCAHVFASCGMMFEVEQVIKEHAVLHSTKASL